MTEPAETGVITTTVPSREVARAIADTLLAERLAACVQFLDIESHYIWKGERAAEPEVMLLIKTRAVLFECARDLGIPVEERGLPIDEAKAADEIFVTSTTREISPVGTWDGQPVGRGDTVTKRLHAALKERVSRETRS